MGQEENGREARDGIHGRSVGGLAEAERCGAEARAQRGASPRKRRRQRRRRRQLLGGPERRARERVRRLVGAASGPDRAKAHRRLGTGDRQVELRLQRRVAAQLRGLSEEPHGRGHMQGLVRPGEGGNQLGPAGGPPRGDPPQDGVDGRPGLQVLVQVRLHRGRRPGVPAVDASPREDRHGLLWGHRPLGVPERLQPQLVRGWRHVGWLAFRRRELVPREVPRHFDHLAVLGASSTIRAACELSRRRGTTCAADHLGQRGPDDHGGHVAEALPAPSAQGGQHQRAAH
mmetsp:Transcript_115959/g.332996  ORF Transcript_115959/g.332996 Transcript_115959/m.332996 type:complete len:287 (+) Transcript_115959:176-1036(+)